jgi:hypothetical protein
MFDSDGKPIITFEQSRQDILNYAHMIKVNM